MIYRLALFRRVFIRGLTLLTLESAGIRCRCRVVRVRKTTVNGAKDRDRGKVTDEADR